jgi:hypothetical protein
MASILRRNADERLNASAASAVDSIASQGASSESARDIALDYLSTAAEAFDHLDIPRPNGDTWKNAPPPPRQDDYPV